MTPPGAWLCGIGMMTPVGDCAAQTAASVRAGISRYQESAVYNKRFEPMTLALLPEENLPPLNDDLATQPGLTSRQMRMLRLAAPALREALQNYAPETPIPLFLAGPEALPGRPLPVGGVFVNHLEIQAQTRLDLTHSRLYPTGRAGGLQALDAALAHLAQGTHDYVLVGGVDTYLDLYLLGTLDMADRVLANGVMDGFCPGEGAGFLLLCSERAKQTRGGATLAKIHPPGIASEPGHRYSEQPYKGDGLAQAVSSAIAHAQAQAEMNLGPIRTVFASLNGENFGAKEWGVALMRNQSAFDEAFQLEHPAEYFGDTGAAVGPIIIGLAAMGMSKAHLASPALVWCSSEFEQRGAVCVTLNNQ